jgi:hypothetical protein
LGATGAGAAVVVLGAAVFGAVAGLDVVVAGFGAVPDVAFGGEAVDAAGFVVVDFVVGVFAVDDLDVVVAGLAVVVVFAVAGFVAVAGSVCAGAVVCACPSGNSKATSTTTVVQADNPRFPSPIDPSPAETRLG